ncbi:MAG: hypothetical protein KDD69_14835, partial [Bdellovibrionales bacterium]|nr:hypothetical protein [Bdellovibrionales bacterium]
PGAPYWESADLRIVLELNASENVVGVQVRDSSGGTFGTNNAGQTSMLFSSCSGQIGGEVVGSSTTMINRRESSSVTRRLLEVDVRGLLDCLHTTNWLGTGKRLDDDTQDGLVFYFTVQGPNSDAQTNRYGFRVRNASQLQSTIAGAPAVGGLTIVSDQAAYVMGHYNSSNWTRSAILADTFNILSSAWNPTTYDGGSFSTRVAANTTVQVAVLSGTDTTGGPNTQPAEEGAAGQSSSTSQQDYNGGLENYPRFHENWSGRTLTYNGSFVSLDRPRHSSGQWSYGSPVYTAPARNWGYDTRFNNAQNLPPMTPRFVYLRQQLFLRHFDQS